MTTSDRRPRPSDRRGPQVVVADVGTYVEAERLVDRLSDDGFPVEHARIVGSGLHSVEYVTGRLTLGRASASGALGGAWFGLLVGLVLGLFATSGTSWIAILVWGLVLGAVWGAAFGFVAQASRRGARDFSSVQGLEADRYAVQVDAAHADDAARRLNVVL